MQMDEDFSVLHQTWQFLTVNNSGGRQEEHYVNMAEKGNSQGQHACLMSTHYQKYHTHPHSFNQHDAYQLHKAWLHLILPPFSYHQQPTMCTVEVTYNSSVPTQTSNPTPQSTKYSQSHLFTLSTCLKRFPNITINFLILCFRAS